MPASAEQCNPNNQFQEHTSARKSSTEAAENVGTRSAPFITEVITSLPDSASSQVIQAAEKTTAQLDALTRILHGQQMISYKET